MHATTIYQAYISSSSSWGWRKSSMNRKKLLVPSYSMSITLTPICKYGQSARTDHQLSMTMNLYLRWILYLAITFKFRPTHSVISPEYGINLGTMVGGNACCNKNKPIVTLSLLKHIYITYIKDFVRTSILWWVQLNVSKVCTSGTHNPIMNPALKRLAREFRVLTNCTKRFKSCQWNFECLVTFISLTTRLANPGK